MAKNTAHFCENRKNHGKITAAYIAANLLKFVVSNSRLNNPIQLCISVDVLQEFM